MQTEENTTTLELVTVDDFETINWEYINRSEIPDTVIGMFSLLIDLASAAKRAGNTKQTKTYKFLAELCGFYIEENKIDVKYDTNKVRYGKMTFIPSDFVGEQSKVLCQIFSKKEHVLLKARVADVIWENTKSNKEWAIKTINLHIALITRILEMDVDCIANPKRLSQGISYLKRGLYISRLINKKHRGMEPQIIACFHTLYNFAIQHKLSAIFFTLVTIGKAYNFITSKDIARDAECYDCDTTYACWLVYVLVCKPVLESLKWDNSMHDVMS